MARGIVLVDTNVIIECHRAGGWRALAGGFSVETVTDCVAETQTGAQRRRPEQRIDEAGLRESLAAVHDVDKAQQAAAFTSRCSMPGSGRSGPTRSGDGTLGCCAGRTRPACASACGSAAASG
jgi:hypothetical protein